MSLHLVAIHASTVKLIPKKFEHAQTVQQERLRNVFDQTYEVYATELRRQREN